MGLTTGPLRYIRRPLEANIRPGNRVLVLSDTRHDPRVWQAVLTILADLGTDATLALFEPRPADYYDPPPLVCDAMKHSDFNILLTSTGMLHSPANPSALSGSRISSPKSRAPFNPFSSTQSTRPWFSRSTM